jgi:hypothetical protein
LFVADDTVLVADGGLATELEARGNDLSDSLWSARLLLDAPEQITDAHLAFFRAGAVIATSASYQASFEGFARRGLDRGQAAGLMRRSVDLARAARDQMAADGRAPRRRLGRPVRRVLPITRIPQRLRPRCRRVTTSTARGSRRWSRPAPISPSDDPTIRERRSWSVCSTTSPRLPG